MTIVRPNNHSPGAHGAPVGERLACARKLSLDAGLAPLVSRRSNIEWLRASARNLWRTGLNSPGGRVGSRVASDCELPAQPQRDVPTCVADAVARPEVIRKKFS